MPLGENGLTKFILYKAMTSHVENTKNAIISANPVRPYIMLYSSFCISTLPRS